MKDSTQDLRSLYTANMSREQVDDVAKFIQQDSRLHPSNFQVDEEEETVVNPLIELGLMN